MAPKAAQSSLSAREMELLHNYMRCMKTRPEIDMEKFTAMSGFGGVPSARANIGRLLSKLAAGEEAIGSPSPSKGNGGEDEAPETPVTGKKKGAGRKRKGDAVEGETAGGTPSKKNKTPSKAKAKTAASVRESEDESPHVKEEVDEASQDGV